MAIIVGVSHAIGGDGDLSFEDLFPHYDFKQDEEVSMESTKANVAKAFGAR